MQSQKEAEIHTCIFLISSSSFLGMLRTNWPFQSYPGPLYQNDVKVARYSFSGSIPPKFEGKLRRHKQRFGKINTTVVLDKDENLLW